MGSITKMEPNESGGKRTREEETPFAIWTQPREEVRLKSVPGNTRLEGGGFERASHRWVEYADVEALSQCGN